MPSLSSLLGSKPDTTPPATQPVGLIQGQPALVIGTVVGVIDAVIAGGLPLPATVRSILIAAVTIAGALGIRSQVRPVATSLPRVQP